jgi:predicted regulator of amino acid metabolism with ACT domain
MDSTMDRFNGYPSQKAVALLMMHLGLSVKGGSAYCGNVKITDASLAKAAGVDRRVVCSTIEHIENDPELIAVFSKLRSMLLLSDVAPAIGCSTLEIIPTDAKMPGILAEVSRVIFEANVSIRQAVVDDTGDQNGARLIVVMDGQLPSEYLPRVRSCRGVASVTIR